MGALTRARDAACEEGVDACSGRARGGSRSAGPALDGPAHFGPQELQGDEDHDVWPPLALVAHGHRAAVLHGAAILCDAAALLCVQHGDSGAVLPVVADEARLLLRGGHPGRRGPGWGEGEGEGWGVGLAWGEDLGQDLLPPPCRP